MSEKKRTKVGWTREQVSIIIPAFNEAQAIGDLVAQIKKLYPDAETIVLDDGSTDGTAQVARDAGAIVYSHPYNIGNGGAVKSGIRLASGGVVVFMDGDGQHDPKDIGRLLKCFPDYDMVVGSRAKGNQASWGRALAKDLQLAGFLCNQVSDSRPHFRVSGSEIGCCP